MAQKSSILEGRVFNEQHETLDGVTISVNDKVFTSTDQYGKYRMRLSSGSFKLTFSITGYITKAEEVTTTADAVIEKNIVLQRYIKPLDEIVIQTSSEPNRNSIAVARGLMKSFPSVSQNFESILKTLPGVSTNNELSAQYSVRGGNFDENLLYLNDVEMIRPLLLRNGQQEGLSFINPDFVSRASFSGGGFAAKYGDRMSSVLDVKYLRPDSTETIISAGLLGFSATYKASLTSGYLLFGFRKKENGGLLKTQEVKGSYHPNFYDLQLLYNRDINSSLNLSFFGNLNTGSFKLIPASRETKFGTLNQLKSFNVNFNGQELDAFRSVAANVTALYKPSERFNIKWMSSVFSNSDQENLDIKADYLFNISDKQKPDSEPELIRKKGFYADYANNRLNSSIISSELKIYQQLKRLYMEWGLRYQRNLIDDRLNEYNTIDSATYAFPSPEYLSGNSDTINTLNSIQTNIYTAYWQSLFNLSPAVSFTGGLRGNYNSFTKQFLVSPRLNFFYTPADNFSLRLAAGIYSQPPFYREFRNFDGSINQNAKAQRSFHLLAGADYSFKSWKKQLKFSSELYYKKLFNLIPYKIENLRVKYFPDQHSRGYAMGADFNLSGEFVEDLESVFRLSLMKTSEDIVNDFNYTTINGNAVRTEPGYLKRPTDQRLNFSAFFQDKLLNSPTYKVHLNILYGSALPVGPPQEERYKDVFKIPAYRRVDIGFSKDLLEKSGKNRSSLLSSYLNSLIIYAEIFNLLDINNTISYLWIKDVDNNQYAIPNYLTSRQLNLRIIAKIK